MSFSWTGRQLDSVTKNGVTTTYTYDSNGLRTSKTTGDDVTEYTYLGSSLVYQVTNKGQSDEVSLYFYYDDTGLAAFYYESAQYPSDNGIYHYVKDAQGNIWGIIDNKGTQIVKYEFSAYGEYRSRWSPEEVSLEEIRRNNRVKSANPFHYRGYYYDEETGLYYCQSRYYDPEVDRWLNADGIIGSNSTVLGYNLFTYCINNPVMYSDPHGDVPGVLSAVYLLFKIGIAITGALLALDLAAAIEEDLPEVRGGKGKIIPFRPTDPEQSPEPAPPPVVPFVSPTSPPEKKEPTVIYRYGGTNPGNLTPREIDKNTGLSFSTIPKAGAAMTTIEAINATGVLYAVKDKATHVSVYPVGGSMKDWINEGSNSIWTKTLKSIVVKWDG